MTGRAVHVNVRRSGSDLVSREKSGQTVERKLKGDCRCFAKQAQQKAKEPEQFSSLIPAFPASTASPFLRGVSRLPILLPLQHT